MKKTILLLMLFVGIATAFTSCKKDDKKSAKEQNLEYLQSGKWYIQSKGTRTCFGESDYWEFKNGKIDGDLDGNTSYSLSENGKILTIGNGSVEITEISNSKLTISVEGVEWKFAKTANENPC